MSKFHIVDGTNGVKPSRFYVYIHRRLDDGLVMYVGKGSSNRAWDTWSRSYWWKKAAAKHGCMVEIYKDNLSEVCALTLEKIVIAKYRSLGHQLTNMTDGGEGVSGLEMPFRKPVRNSLGERFAHINEAAQAMRDRGYLGASSGEISSAASGKRHSANGCSWWYEGEEAKGFIDRRVRQAITVGKLVISSDGFIFNSLSDAANYLRGVGYPKAKSYNISLAARGDMDYAYGRSWLFYEECEE